MTERAAAYANAKFYEPWKREECKKVKGRWTRWRFVTIHYGYLQMIEKCPTLDYPKPTPPPPPPTPEEEDKDIDPTPEIKGKVNPVKTYTGYD